MISRCDKTNIFLTTNSQIYNFRLFFHVLNFLNNVEIRCSCSPDIDQQRANKSTLCEILKFLRHCSGEKYGLSLMRKPKISSESIRNLFLVTIASDTWQEYATYLLMILCTSSSNPRSSILSPSSRQKYLQRFIFSLP